VSYVEKRTKSCFFINSRGFNTRNAYASPVLSWDLNPHLKTPLLPTAYCLLPSSISDSTSSFHLEWVAFIEAKQGYKVSNSGIMIWLSAQKNYLRLDVEFGYIFSKINPVS
jgi:hypothetical protein